jgi:hypothetical protein
MNKLLKQKIWNAIKRVNKFLTPFVLPFYILMFAVIWITKPELHSVQIFEIEVGAVVISVLAIIFAPLMLFALIGCLLASVIWIADKLHKGDSVND